MATSAKVAAARRTLGILSMPRNSLLSRLLAKPVRARRLRSGRLPQLERLEERTVLSTVNLMVTSTADTGPGTLRAAITSADQGSSANQYVIRFSAFGTIDLHSALPDLSNNIAIRGPGSTHLAIQRDSNALPFRILTVDKGSNSSITNVQINNGSGAVTNHGTLSVSGSFFGNDSAFNGGAIFNDGKLTVTLSLFSNDSAVGISGLVGSGGAIDNAGTATITSSTFSHDTARDAVGGAISNRGTLTVRNVKFSHDTAPSNTGGTGGAIFNFNGTATVSSSSFLGNSSRSAGGAVFNQGTFTINGSTFFANTSVGGGAVFTGGGSLVVNSSVFLFNAAPVAGGGAIFDQGGSFHLSGVIFFGNTPNNIAH